MLTDAFKSSSPAGANNRSQLLLLHLLVTIVLSYQLLFSKDTIFTFEVSSGISLGLLLLTAGLVMLPVHIWETGRFVSVLVLVDTLITSGAIYFSGVSDSGLYITFFLIILISASTPSLKQAIALGLVPCVGYALVLVAHVGDVSRLSEGDLLRIPILLILATFYGAAAETGRRLHERAERILVESEIKFRSVVEQAHEPIILMDGEGRMLSWNKAAQAVFGYTADEAVGQSFKFLVPVRYRGMWDLQWFHEQSGSQLIGSTIEFQALHQSGVEFPCELSLATWTTDDGTFFSGIIRDVSERKRMEEWVYRKEEQLRQAQKMEAIGRLASQVAHDFNHVLFVILSCSELLLRRMAEEDPGRGKLDEIRKAAERGHTLTQQLLNYARKQPRKPGNVNLNTVVTDLIPMLERLVGKDITIRADLAPSLGSVVADTAQVEQVIVNLATNGRDAMPRGGTLTIATRTVTADEAGLSEMMAPSGACAMLTVTDTGVGMDAETKARCLEPFFTTKAVGQGTGLGLATVSDIIQQSGGRIEVESAVDAGTTMRLYLPQAEPLVQSAPVAASKGGGAKTLLIVDDDAHSRRAMTEILKYKGYRVLEAGSGADAVTMLSERREPVDLLLTDVVMPAMNGRELAARLTELRPGLKIIYVSGYSPDQISNYGVVGSGQTILLKPFTPETLSSRVRTALDAH